MIFKRYLAGKYIGIITIKIIIPRVKFLTRDFK